MNHLIVQKYAYKKYLLYNAYRRIVYISHLKIYIKRLDSIKGVDYYTKIKYIDFLLCNKDNRFAFFENQEIRLRLCYYNNDNNMMDATLIEIIDYAIDEIELKVLAPYLTDYIIQVNNIICPHKILSIKKKKPSLIERLNKYLTS